MSQGKSRKNTPDTAANLPLLIALEEVLNILKKQLYFS